MSTLCLIGQNQDCAVFASPEWVSFPVDGDKRLYDVVWYNEDLNLRQRGIQLVAEVQLGYLDEVEESLNRLLLSRAAIRVIVYDAKQGNKRSSEPTRAPRSNRLLNQIARRIRESGNTRPGDLFLLIAYREEPDGFSTIRDVNHHFDLFQIKVEDPIQELVPRRIRVGDKVKG